MASTPSVKQLRVVLEADDLDAAVAYYRDAIGLTESAAFAGDAGARVVILDAGRSTLELTNAAQARFIASVEAEGRPSTRVRLAFEVDDTGEASDRLRAFGAHQIAGPVRTPWNSVNARFTGAAGVQVTLFQELSPASGQDGPAELVGTRLVDLGGEPGVLDRVVELARAHGSTGALPFAAVVERAGVLVGAGVNTAIADSDPSEHGEIVAIRDAVRRSGSMDLRGSVVYSSCEPCALCRTLAAANGVDEIVYAAGNELVPRELDTDPQLTNRLIDAVTDVVPHIARRGTTTLTEQQLGAPFRAYAMAGEP